MSIMDSEEYCSLSCNVMGVKFYDGGSELHSLMHVRLCRELTNHADYNAIRIVTPSGKILGHLEKKIAAFIAPIMDAGLPGFKAKA